MRFPALFFAVCVWFFVFFTPVTATAADAFGPLPPQNPFMAPLGIAGEHNDAESSDAGPLPGPGAKLSLIVGYPLLADCATITQGTDGLVVALCTADLNQVPTVMLIDPGGIIPRVIPLATLLVAKGSLLGGVYAYLDNNNQLVLIDGSKHLLRVAHSRDARGCWQLTITSSIDLSGVILPGDSAIALVPDYQGNVWFATQNAVVGVAKTAGGLSGMQLPAGEGIFNSISSSPSGRVGVATTFALYELNLDGGGNPQILWRAAYDRGPGRKPGQLSWGTGSTPVYFGPTTGADYLSILDNAVPYEHALIYQSGTGQLICEQTVLTKSGSQSGSENAPIGIGKSFFISSTYGYKYPALPEGAPPATPPTAPFVGGMTRVDVDNPGCHTVWDNNTVRSAALPHLSTGDGLIYTITRIGPLNTTPLDVFAYGVVDPNTGKLLVQQPKSATLLTDPLQTPTMVLLNGKLMQPSITGIARIG